MAVFVGGYLTDDIARGITINKKQPVAPTPVPMEQLRQAADVMRNQPQNQKYVRSEPRVSIDPSNHYLVVDGKTKQIGKQSRYLVDMLTTEE